MIQTFEALGAIVLTLAAFAFLIAAAEWCYWRAKRWLRERRQRLRDERNIIAIDRKAWWGKR
jgi:hypothetical protein